jgi:hypothetical protein
LILPERLVLLHRRGCHSKRLFLAFTDKRSSTRFSFSPLRESTRIRAVHRRVVTITQALGIYACRRPVMALGEEESRRNRQDRVVQQPDEAVPHVRRLLPPEKGLYSWQRP